MDKLPYLVGPWTVEVGEDYGEYRILEQTEQFTQGDTAEEDLFFSEDRNARFDQGNALLIAWAPELYHLLRSLLRSDAATALGEGVWQEARERIKYLDSRLEPGC